MKLNSKSKLKASFSVQLYLSSATHTIALNLQGIYCLLNPASLAKCTDLSQHLSTRMHLHCP